MKLHAVCVGAGSAGLAAALTFGRMRRRVLVVDSGEPRNHYTAHLHNFPTRDGVEPSGYRRLARAEAESYPSVEFRDDRAIEASTLPMDVRPSNTLAGQLGCTMTDPGFVEVDALGRTSVPRVYAAGDAASPVHQAILAAASGTRAALAAIHDALEAFELA